MSSYVVNGVVKGLGNPCRPENGSKVGRSQPHTDREAYETDEFASEVKAKVQEVAGEAKAAVSNVFQAIILAMCVGFLAIQRWVSLFLSLGSSGAWWARKRQTSVKKRYAMTLWEREALAFLGSLFCE